MHILESPQKLIVFSYNPMIKEIFNFLSSDKKCRFKLVVKQLSYNPGLSIASPWNCSIRACIISEYKDAIITK